MDLPKTIEEFVAQSEAVAQMPGYRGDFVRFGIGFADINPDTNEIESVDYLQVNTQESGAGGTYNHLFKHFSEDFLSRGYAFPTLDQIKALQDTFNPFRGDGKSHPNIDALDGLSDTEGSSDKPVVVVIYEDSQSSASNLI